MIQLSARVIQAVVQELCPHHRQSRAMVVIAIVGIGDLHDLDAVVLGVHLGDKIGEIAGFYIDRRFQQPKRPVQQLELRQQLFEPWVEGRDKRRPGISRRSRASAAIVLAKSIERQRLARRLPDPR